MKSSIKTMFVVLAIVMSFVAVQGVWADTVTVEGTIDSISTKPNMIVVDEGDGVLTDVYGIKFNYLANQYNIVLETGTAVSVDVYEYECSDGTIKLMACKIKVGDVTVDLRMCQ